MENKVKGERQRIVLWVLNIIIIILSFLLIMTIGVMIKEGYNVLSAAHDQQSIQYALQGDRYYDMVRYYHDNVQAGFEGDSTMKEYYGVAKYYEAASLYHAYTVAENTSMAEHFQEKMEQAEKEMGSWSITKDVIKETLGIE